MKKLLIAILIILLLVLASFTIIKGIIIGPIKILSVEQIIQANEKLNKDIEKAKTLLEVEYKNNNDDLSKAVNTLLKRKEEYFTMAKISTEGEISKANTEETYLIEYLWTRVGNHASSKGINLEMKVNQGDSGEANMYNLGFTIDGQYISIIKFISALENDDKLAFKIENFKMTKNHATFNVRNVRIKAESITNAVAQRNGD